MGSSNINREYIEIKWLRAIAVLLLVIWHCFFCPMSVWGVVEPGEEVVIFKLLSGFFIPDAVMPLFTFISGYLFYALYQKKNKYRDFSLLFYGKVKRLLIPFFVFSLLIIPTSFNLTFNELLWGEGTHMWYCAMLFWCFIIDWCLKKVNNSVVTLCVAIFSTGLVFLFPNFWFLPFKLPLGIDNGLYYYSYFIWGGIVYKYRSRIYKRLSSKIIGLILLYLLFYVFDHLHLKLISRVSSFVNIYLYVIILWLVVRNLLERSLLKSDKIVSNICYYSFGIYVFHHWIVWNIVWSPLGSDILQKHYILFPLFLTPIVFFCAYYVTKLCLKTRIGRYLLL